MFRVLALSATPGNDLKVYVLLLSLSRSLPSSHIITLLYNKLMFYCILKYCCL